MKLNLHKKSQLLWLNLDSESIHSILSNIRIVNVDYVILSCNSIRTRILEVLFLVVYYARSCKVVCSIESLSKAELAILRKSGLHGLLIEDAIYDFDEINSNSKQLVGEDNISSNIIKLLQRLSSTEIEILFYFYIGLSNSDVANALHRSYHTVKNHKLNIVTKLGLDGTRGLNYLMSKIRFRQEVDCI